MSKRTHSTFIHLECTSCNKIFPKEQLLNLCPSCSLPLFARYDMERARVEKIDGIISDCGAVVNQRKEQEGWFDVSTLKEPYRVEGKKTLTCLTI